jgi:hypothetical protein
MFRSRSGVTVTNRARVLTPGGDMNDDSFTNVAKL